MTCGDVGIEKAVIVPKTLFQLMLLRLSEGFKTKYKTAALSAWGSKLALQGFLATRCSKEFLAAYISQNPRTLDEVSRPGLFLYAVSEVDLAIRLHEFGLLPEDRRQRFVATVSTYAIQGDDVYAIDSARIRQMFKDEEFEELLQNVRKQLLPRLGDVRQDWQLNHQSSESAEEHMEQLLESFDVLMRRFGDDPNAVRIIEQETQRANEWIGEHTSEEPEIEPRTLGQLQTPDKPLGTRSIFDDIDA